jgi:hypothetical protein
MKTGNMGFANSRRIWIVAGIVVLVLAMYLCSGYGLYFYADHLGRACFLDEGRSRSEVVECLPFHVTEKTCKQGAWAPESAKESQCVEYWILGWNSLAIRAWFDHKGKLVEHSEVFQ